MKQHSPAARGDDGARLCAAAHEISRFGASGGGVASEREESHDMMPLRALGGREGGWNKTKIGLTNQIQCHVPRCLQLAAFSKVGGFNKGLHRPGNSHRGKFLSLTLTANVINTS